MDNPHGELMENVESVVGEYFNDCVVLITGGTGFLGKLLLEKLLRTCSGVRTVYVVVRSQKGKSLNDRIRDLFTDTVRKNDISTSLPLVYIVVFHIK